MDLKRHKPNGVCQPVPVVDRLTSETTSASARPSVPPFVSTLPIHSSTSLEPVNTNTIAMDLHHPILREFPEYREVIRGLRGTNDHFRKMFDEYHQLDDSVYRIEEEIDFATDQEIEELKMRRAKLKDYIYHLITHVPTSSIHREAHGVARPHAS
jgi:uncharacterized protein YdcH (DUF465 family)